MEFFATVLGYMGMGCLVCPSNARKRSGYFFLQMLSGLFFVFHYGLLGDYTGMAMDGVCFVRALMMTSGRR